MGALPLQSIAADSLYMVYMNPFVVQAHEQAAIDAGYVKPEVPSVVKAEDQTNYIIRNIDRLSYSPGVERAKAEIISEASLRRVDKTIPQLPAFFANLDDHELKALSRSNRVVAVKKMNMDEKSFTLSSYYDYVSGGETTPWGKQAIAANDSLSATNNFYVVDAKYNSPALSGELNVIYTNNEGADHPDHAASVLSLAAGRNNSSRIRGINPGQPIVHVGTYLNEADIIYKIAWASSMAEWAGQFSTLNLSVKIDPTSVLALKSGLRVSR